MAASLYVRTVLVLACSYKREEENQAKYLNSQEKIFEILQWTSRLTNMRIFIIKNGTSPYLNYRLIKSKEPNPVLGDLSSSVISSISNLIMIHSITWKVFHQFLDVTLEMVMRFPSSTNLTLAMNCAYRCLAFVWSERSIGNDCDVETDDRIQLLIKFVLECHNTGAKIEKLCFNEVNQFIHYKNVNDKVNLLFFPCG